MKRFTIPIRNLPFGLSGYIEVTETAAIRDWRDTAIGLAVVFGIAPFVLPHVYRLDPWGIVAGSGVLFYLVYAIEELRIFTRRDRVAFTAVIEYEPPFSPPEEDDIELMPLFDMDTDDGTGEAHLEGE